jgi:hypothetical protein
METSLVLARFWGIILVVLCGSLLVNAKFYVRLVKGFQDEVIRFLYFFVVLVIGAVNVSLVNQWTWNQAGLITLLGWGSLLKGSFGILLPDFSNKIIQKVRMSPAVIYPSGVVFLLVGCYLLFCGFVYKAGL